MKFKPSLGRLKIINNLFGLLLSVKFIFAYSSKTIK